MWALGPSHPEWVLPVPLRIWVDLGKKHHFSEPQPAGLLNGVIPAPCSEGHCEDQVRELAWSLHGRRALHLLASIRREVGVGGSLSESTTQARAPRTPPPQALCIPRKSHIWKSRVTVLSCSPAMQRSPDPDVWAHLGHPLIPSLPPGTTTC